LNNILKVKEYNELESLKDQWNGFLAESLDNNIFSTWEWLSIWWKHFGKNKKSIILTVEDENDILAIAPFVYSKHSLFKFGKLKRISFMGSPESDYNVFILKKKQLELLELFFDYLDENVDWNQLDLKDIPENSSSFSLLHKIPIANQYSHWEENKKTICPYIPLPTSMDVFMKSLSHNMRYNLRRYSRRLEKNHRVELKNFDEIGSVKETMDVFFKLHQKRWTSKGELGVFNESVFRNFHTDVAECFAKKGWLRLHFLTVDDEIVSATYDFNYNQKVYFYLSGWDPKYSQYMVGNLAHKYEIAECIREGLTEYDLMRGNEAYKRKWTTKTRKNVEINFAREGLSPRFHSWLMNCNLAEFMFYRLGITLP
jgi:CelD/BcsL family acetyltransferase involved in cellulose biosynthesis